MCVQATPSHHLYHTYVRTHFHPFTYVSSFVISLGMLAHFDFLIFVIFLWNAGPFLFSYFLSFRPNHAGVTPQPSRHPVRSITWPWPCSSGRQKMGKGSATEEQETRKQSGQARKDATVKGRQERLQLDTDATKERTPPRSERKSRKLLRERKLPHSFAEIRN